MLVHKTTDFHFNFFEPIIKDPIMDKNPLQFVSIIKLVYERKTKYVTL